MHVDIGEQLVGAYSKIIERCDVVSYNVRAPGGKLRGLGELNVIGLRYGDAEPGWISGSEKGSDPALQIFESKR